MSLANTLVRVMIARMLLGMAITVLLAGVVIYQQWRNPSSDRPLAIGPVPTAVPFTPPPTPEPAGPPDEGSCFRENSKAQRTCEDLHTEEAFWVRPAKAADIDASTLQAECVQQFDAVFPKADPSAHVISWRVDEAVSPTLVCVLEYPRGVVGSQLATMDQYRADPPVTDTSVGFDLSVIAPGDGPDDADGGRSASGG